LTDLDGVFLSIADSMKSDWNALLQSTKILEEYLNEEI
jgi:hypothetical protein